MRIDPAPVGAFAGSRPSELDGSPRGAVSRPSARARIVRTIEDTDGSGPAPGAGAASFPAWASPPSTVTPRTAAPRNHLARMPRPYDPRARVSRTAIVP